MAFTSGSYMPTDKQMWEPLINTNVYKRPALRIVLDRLELYKNLMWDYKNEVLKETAHLKLDLELMEIDKWDMTRIDSRTKELIEKICVMYPYPEVSVTQKIDDGGVDEMTALDMCIEMAISEQPITCIRKRRMLIDYESWFLQKKLSGDLNMIRTTAIAKSFSQDVIDYVNQRSNIEKKPIKLIKYTYANGNFSLELIKG